MKIEISKFDIFLGFSNRIYYEFFCPKQLMNYLNYIQTEKKMNELYLSKILLKDLCKSSTLSNILGKQTGSLLKGTHA